MILRNYKQTENNIWTGRIDDPNDPDSYRMHQIIKLIDLKTIDKVTFDRSKINICFIGFCCDEGVQRNLGRPGAAKGPEAIRKEYSNLPVVFGNSASIYDAGDIHCLDNNLTEAQEQLSIAVKEILDSKLFPIVLGGGHEVALGNFNGIVNHLENKDTPAIINFDAHIDMRPYKDGSSSGTMFYQIADICNEKNLPFSYLCLGTQTYGNTLSLFKRADNLGAKYIHAKDITEPNYVDVLGKIFNFIDNKEHVYVTICCDVFNSAYAPGVSSTQPFGLNPEVVLKFLKQIFKTKKVVCFDIAEVSPRFDHDNNTAKLAAVIIFAIVNALVDYDE